MSSCKNVTLTGTGNAHILINDENINVTDVVIASGRNSGINLSHTIAYDGQVGFVFQSAVASGSTVRVNYAIIK